MYIIIIANFSLNSAQNNQACFLISWFPLNNVLINTYEHYLCKILMRIDNVKGLYLAA